MNSESKDVLGKITEWPLVPLGGHPVEVLLTKVCTTRERVASKKDELFDKLQKVAAERDISVEKIKNAIGLDVDLPKSSGYEGSIDVFQIRIETFG